MLSEHMMDLEKVIVHVWMAQTQWHIQLTSPRVANANVAQYCVMSNRQAGLWMSEYLLFARHATGLTPYSCKL